MKRVILCGAFAALCGAQTTVNGGRDYKGTLKASGSVSAVDFSGAGATAPAKAGTLAARPTACTQGQIYFATDVAAGQNLFFCTATGAPGIWTQMSGTGTSTTIGSGAAAYISTLISGPDSTRTITGATHGFATTALLVAVYDNASPRNAISAGWTVAPSTHDVTITFGSPQSNYYVVINGGVGPAGPAGPAGPPGASGSGAGSVNPTGTIAANRIATFTDTTGNGIQDGTQHSMGSGYLSSTQTAGSGGVTANLLCKVDSTGNVVLPGAGDTGILGVCASTQSSAQPVEVATRGVINCVADNATTIGHIAIAGTSTAGRCKDSGQSAVTGIAESTQVLGRFRSAASAGSTASLELYGPEHYGARVLSSDVPADNRVRVCEVVIGDPGAASPALANDNDSPAVCGNKTGSTLTITGVECYADAGSPTVTPVLTGGGAILTGPLTCGAGSFTSGTLSGTPTQANNGSIDANITTAGGTAKYIVIRITRTL